MSYDVFKTNSKGGVTLPPKWMKKNLGVEFGDMILVEHVEEEGRSILKLSKFNPADLRKASQEEVSLGQNDEEKEKEFDENLGSSD